VRGCGKSKKMWVQDFLKQQPQAKTLRTHLIANNMFLKLKNQEYYIPVENRVTFLTKLVRFLTSLLVYGFSIIIMISPQASRYGATCSHRDICRSACVDNLFPDLTCNEDADIVVHFGGNVYPRVYRYHRAIKGEDETPASYTQCRNRIREPTPELATEHAFAPDKQLEVIDVCFAPCRDPNSVPEQSLVGPKDTRPFFGTPECTSDKDSYLYIVCVLPDAACEVPTFLDETCIAPEQLIYEDSTDVWSFCWSTSLAVTALVFAIPGIIFFDVLFVFTASIVVDDLNNFRAASTECGLQWLLVLLVPSLGVMFGSSLLTLHTFGRPSLFYTTAVLVILIDQIRNIISQTFVWYIAIRRFGKVPLVDESVYYYDQEPGAVDILQGLAQNLVASKGFEIGTIVLMFVFLFQVLGTTIVMEDLEKNNWEMSIQALIIADLVILILFTIEILIRAFADGPAYFMNIYNFLDAGLILICLIWAVQGTGADSQVVMFRLLRLLRVFMVMQRTGEKKRKMNKKGGGVSFSSPSERVLETMTEIKQNKSLSQAMREKVEWVSEVISAKKLDQVVVDMGSKPDGMIVDNEAQELQKLASDADHDVSSVAANELENFLMGRQKRKANDDGSKQIQELIREIPSLTRAQAETYLMDEGEKWTFDIFEFREYSTQDGVEITDSEKIKHREDYPDMEANRYEYDDEVVSMMPLLLLHCFKLHDIYSIFDVNPGALVEFARRMEAGYPPVNPYHNSIHACEVMEAASMFLLWSASLMRSNQPVLNAQDKLCLFFATCMMDYEHPGLTNQFLVAVHHPMAVLYNDLFVLEQHHVSAAFMAMFNLEQDPLQAISEDQFQQIRRCIIKLVMSTDLTSHFNETMPGFKTKMSAKDFPSAKAEDKQIVLNIILHGSEFSRHARPLPVCLRWTVRYMEEAFRQGDEEVKQKLQVSRFFERGKASIPKVQSGFIEGFVQPTYDLMVQILPDMQDEIMPQLHANKMFFLKKKGGLEEEDEPNDHASRANKRKSQALPKNRATAFIQSSMPKKSIFERVKAGVRKTTGT
jgi:hypothetical protein